MLGHCRPSTPFPRLKAKDDSLRTERIIEREVLITLAGPAAASRFTRHGLPRVGAEIQQAYNFVLCSYLSGNSIKEKKRHLYRMIARSGVLIDDWWPAVEALAAALLVEGKIGYKRARQIIGNAVARLEPFESLFNTRKGSKLWKAKMPPKPKRKCPHGHRYTAANTYVNPSGGRCCRTCMAAKDKRRIRCIITDPRKRRNKINRLLRSQRKRLAAQA